MVEPQGTPYIEPTPVCPHCADTMRQLAEERARVARLRLVILDGWHDQQEACEREMGLQPGDLEPGEDVG